MSDYDYYEEDEGIHFEPYDHELINNYLIPKLRGDLRDDFIVMKNVYAKEPWLLDHTMDPFFNKDEWYYFVTRTQVSEKKIGCGKKAKRKITGDDYDGIDRGNWKANATTDIKDKKGKTIGVKQTLTYTRSNKNKKQKIGEGTCAIVPGSDSSWIMKEYMLPEGENFQDLVLCKIKIKKSKKKNDHEASSSTSTSTSTYHHEASTSSYSSTYHHESMQQWINIDPEINKKEEVNGFIAVGEGSMVHQLDQLVSIERVIDISSQQFRSENDDQAMKSCGRLSVDQEINNKGLGGAEEGNIPIALDKSENLRYEKDDQVHIDAPLLSVGYESYAPIRSEEEYVDWFQVFDYHVEEGNNVLLFDNHESAIDSSSEKRPINEGHRDESENLGAEKDNDAPLVCLESAPEWLKKFVESMLKVDGPGLLMEEDEEELLIHNAPCLDQDLYHQFAVLCPTKTSQTS